VGVGLLLVELLVIPGFGIAGIAGILFMLAGLLAALIGNVGLSFPSAREIGRAIATLTSTLILLGVGIAALGRYLPRTRRFQELVLGTGLARTQGYAAAATEVQLVGKRGRAVTPLRPAGVVEIAGRRYDVVASGQFVPAGTPVEVVRVQGSRIEVRPLSEAEHQTS